MPLIFVNWKGQQNQNEAMFKVQREDEGGEKPCDFSKQQRHFQIKRDLYLSHRQEGRTRGPLGVLSHWQLHKRTNRDRQEPNGISRAAGERQPRDRRLPQGLQPHLPPLRFTYTRFNELFRFNVQLFPSLLPAILSLNTYFFKKLRLKKKKATLSTPKLFIAVSSKGFRKKKSKTT